MEPYCRRCAAKGVRTKATVADHIVRHYGVEALFFDLANTQSLCAPCHDRDKQSIEHLGFDKTIGDDGWPADPAHPVNSGTKPQPYSIPHYLQPSAIPVHLVCGAPGSGKTTFVRANAKPGDTVIDFDDIRQSIGAPRYSEDPAHLAAAFAIRDRMLRALSRTTKGQAWLIVMAPTRHERDAWVKALVSVTIHSIDTGPDECKRRILADQTRAGATEKLIAAVDRYFKARDGR